MLTDGTPGLLQILLTDTASKPALAAVSDTEVYLAVRGSDNRIYVNRWDGTGWANWNQIPTGNARNGPSITVANGRCTSPHGVTIMVSIGVR
jgi:hypothetical protein